MQTQTKTTPVAELLNEKEAATKPLPAPELLNEKQAAALLGCSTRHLRRLKDAGKAPMSIRLGGSVKWRRTELDEWIADGCPRVRIVRGGAA